MLQAAVGFRVTRKDWVNKNVTTSDGNEFTPILTEKYPADPEVSSYEASDEDQAAADWSVL